MTRRLRTMLRDRRGVSAIEFGLVAPVMCLLLLGCFDMAHTLYMNAVLQGIVQKTARDSTLQANSNDPVIQAAIDAKITALTTELAKSAQLTFKRRNYKTFSDAQAAQQEPYRDTNNNNRCDNNEAYTDVNNNGVWDADGGNSNGGAKDRTVYTVNITYPHLVPIWNFIGVSNTVSMTARTVLEIQPYDEQSGYGAPATRYCPA